MLFLFLSAKILNIFTRKYMVVAISGASGFVGQMLVKKMTDNGWTIRIIDRYNLALPDAIFLEQLIEGADVVINLAGAPITRKWTEAWKKEIFESRILTTRKIATAIGNAENKPALFISTSAIGIYNSTHRHTESSTMFADTFLADVCRNWEAEALSVQQSTRVVIFRNGLILGEHGGALKKMEGLFKYGLGGKIGNGRQPVSFIHLSDLLDALFFVIEHSGMHGIYNAVSPFPATNREFTEKLGKVLGQPAILTIPAFILKLIYGEGAIALLEGQYVIPQRLEEAGFRFKYPTLQSALIRIYK